MQLDTQGEDDGVGARFVQVPAQASSIETDMVGLLQARNAFLANLAVFRTSQQVSDSLLKTAV